jgi:hypothetical protein
MDEKANVSNVAQNIIDLATGLVGEFLFKEISYKSEYSTELIFCKKNEELNLEKNFYKFSITSTDKWNSVFLICLEYVEIIDIDKWPYKRYFGTYQEIQNFDKIVELLSEHNYNFADNILYAYNKVIEKQKEKRK